MIPPVVAGLLVATVPAVLCIGFLAAMAIVVGALAEIEAADERLLRRCVSSVTPRVSPRDQSLGRGPAARMSSAVPSA